MKAKMRMQTVGGNLVYTNYAGEDAEYPTCYGSLTKNQLLFCARVGETWTELATRFNDKPQCRLVKISRKLANAKGYGADKGVVVTYAGGMGYK